MQAMLFSRCPAQQQLPFRLINQWAENDGNLLGQ